MQIPKKVTATWLTRHGACVNQIIRFKELFPNGMIPTPENLRLASKQKLSVRWFFEVIGVDHQVFSLCCGGSLHAGFKAYIKAWESKRHSNES